MTYIAIFLSSLAGYFALPPYLAVVAGLAVAVASYVGHSGLYRRAVAAGYDDEAKATFTTLTLCALTATILAYGGGMAVFYLSAH